MQQQIQPGHVPVRDFDPTLGDRRSGICEMIRKASDCCCKARLTCNKNVKNAHMCSAVDNMYSVMKGLEEERPEDLQSNAVQLLLRDSVTVLGNVRLLREPLQPANLCLIQRSHDAERILTQILN